MSEERRPVRFETEQLPEFLEHIARQEAQELERMRREHESAARSVRTEARRRSRQYHRRVSESTRARLETEHLRRLSRARSGMRRRRWQLLQDLRRRAHDRVWKLLLERWRRPERQQSWCRYWLEQCEKLQGGEPLEVRLSGDVHAATVEAVRRWAADAGSSVNVLVDESLGEGILIEVGERSLDGRLETQLERLLASIHRELAGWLHDDAAGESGG